MAHILISDDSIAMRQMLAYTLTEASHEVMQADNGQAALRLAQSHSFDLVITDVNMPLLDGLSLVKELRALPNYRFKPILLLTTETDPQKKQIAKKSGATGWIIKPFNPDKLLMAVRKVLG
ncbi:response regulator [Candidatus Albibeggiatoa sp. nov. NOAA]|uniref:response regulator n=1 Tax=Candidatus Albibeggiatoa sp. nov. NOAA TaxID=3162724 RepID=UPI0032FCBC22|nr:response regulator [Thiotrichaceae bacterium]